MHHFFVDPATLRADTVTLTGDLAHQLGRVLRLRPGDPIALLDDTGWAWEAELTDLARQAVHARLVRRWQPHTELRLPISLFQALPKGKKLELILQKATELGASAIVPMRTRYAVAQSGGSTERLARWQQIVREAAEQSGRARLPQVHEPQPWADACQPPAEHTLALIACLHPQAQPLNHVLALCDLEQLKAISLYIGPEGGFSPDEITNAITVGIVPVSLGPRILRTETAPLMLLSVLAYALGEMDQPESASA